MHKTHASDIAQVVVPKRGIASYAEDFLEDSDCRFEIHLYDDTK